MAVAVVLEQHVAASNGRDVEIGIAVVVDIGERRRDADLAGYAHTGRLRDVLELAAAEVPPELIAADLIQKVDVEKAVAVDVGDRDAVPVIVVRGLVRLARVLDSVMDERNTAFGEPVGELEIVECLDGRTGIQLSVAETLKPVEILEIVRHELHLGGAGRGSLCDRRPHHGRRGRDQHRSRDRASNSSVHRNLLVPPRGLSALRALSRSGSDPRPHPSEPVAVRSATGSRAPG